MVRVRPLTLLDLERLASFDAPLAGRDGRETWIGRASVQMFERTGHAFVAERGSGPTTEVAGFVLASTSWDGNRPTVRMTALVVDGDDDRADQTRAAMLEALTKSAYDAAVYDLVAEVPASDERTLSVALASGWRRDDVVLVRRTLGSRGG